MYMLQWLKEWYKLNFRRVSNYGFIGIAHPTPLDRITWLENRFAELIVGGACPVDSPDANQLADIIHAEKLKYPVYFRKEL